MRRFAPVAFALICLGNSVGCAITSAANTTTNGQGAVWYVKQPVLAPARVYYCPPKANACYRAEVH